MFVHHVFLVIQCHVRLAYAIFIVSLFLAVFSFNWHTNLFKVIILSNIVLVLILKSKAQLVSPRPCRAQYTPQYKSVERGKQLTTDNFSILRSLLVFSE